jgi:hypothetical protein
MLYKYAEILANEVLFSGMCPEQSGEYDVRIWNDLFNEFVMRIVMLEFVISKHKKN